jgi:hypothetical protein
MNHPEALAMRFHPGHTFLFITPDGGVLRNGVARLPQTEGQEPAAVITYTDEPSPETGDVGWCWWAHGSMGCAPTYEGACRAAEAEIKRRIRNRMAVL